MTSAATLAATSQVSLKDILFTTDFSEGSEHALPFLRALARPFNAAVHLCHIEPPVPLTHSMAAPGVYEASGKITAEHLTALLNAPMLKGLHLNLALGSGRIKDEVLHIIRQRHIDLVVAGTHGRAGFRKFLLGSVVEEIIRIAPCPVLIVGPCTRSRTDLPFKKILFPTDLTESSDKALPWLLLLARQFDSQVTALHVIAQEATATTGDGALRRAMKSAMVESLAPRLEQFNPEFQVEEGDPADTILRVAGERKIDLIAMGTSNKFLPGVQLRSSAAYRIMAGAGCPVLVAKCAEPLHDGSKGMVKSL